MALWLVNLNSSQQWNKMRSERVISIGFDEMPDLSPIRKIDELEAFYITTYINLREGRFLKKMNVDMIWCFLKEMKRNDLVVVLPLKHEKVYQVGIVKGDYEYKKNHRMKHTRKIEWQNEIQETEIDRNLLNLFNSNRREMLIQIKDYSAEKRIKEILNQKKTSKWEKVPNQVKIQGQKEKLEKMLELLSKIQKGR
jgi:predicted Mrr-cat superfamily restriction endonuclease